MNSKKRTAIKIEDVGASYWRRSGLLRRDKLWALKSVSFDLYYGETLGIIGRNGAGKSTLLRLLAGIIDPDKGTISRKKDDHVALLSLQVGFNNHLSGRDNVILSGMLLGNSRQKMLQKMDEIIAFSEIGEFIDQPVRVYSAGMRARLGFSVVFTVDPDITLIDETLGVGDNDFRNKSANAMREKIASDKTFVFVSHSVPLVKSICDRVVWIENGVTKMVGTPDEVMEKYLAK